MTRTVALALCLVGGLAVKASAATIYSESVSGDLGNIPPFTLLTLGIGANTVSGNQWAMPRFGADDDSFAFTVPSGAALTNITYATTLTSGPSGLVFYTLAINNGVAPGLGSQIIDLGSASPTSVFSTTMPLGAATYSLYNSFSGGVTFFGWTDTYTWTLTVAPIETSVPDTGSTGSLLLLGTGLLGAGLRRVRARATVTLQ